MQSASISFPSPYPESWKDISDFRYLTPLRLFRGIEKVRRPGQRDALYILAADYRVNLKVDGQTKELVVPKGMVTDLVSVPAILRPFAGRVGVHLEAAIVHDWLFVAWQDADGGSGQKRRRDFEFANCVMLAALKAANVAGWKRKMFGLAIGTAYDSYCKRESEPRYVVVPD